jgi:hypothetical protein
MAVTARKTYSEGRRVGLSDPELATFSTLDLPETLAVDVARGLDEVLAPGEAAAASFAGFTAVYSDRTIIDTLGLNDRYVARLPIARPGVPGHEKFAPRTYLESRNVRIVNPWPKTDPGGPDTPMAVRLAGGAYLHFDIIEPADRVAARLGARGLDVWVGGHPVFDPARLKRTRTVASGDFEADTWDGWTLSGTAFGSSPREGPRAGNASRVTGFRGSGFVNTYLNDSDRDQGRATSAPFELTADVVHFLIAGGRSSQTSLELWVDGGRVRTASGRDSESLVRRAWDVTEFRGKRAWLVIRDDESASWGHIVVDDIQIGESR